MRRQKDIIVGIDLAAKPSKPTGWALLKRSKVSSRHLFTDEEMHEKGHPVLPPCFRSMEKLALRASKSTSA